MKRTKQARRACTTTRSDGAVKEVWSRRVATTKRALIQHQHEELCPSTGLLERLKNMIDSSSLSSTSWSGRTHPEEITRTSRTRSRSATEKQHHQRYQFEEEAHFTLWKPYTFSKTWRSFEPRSAKDECRVASYSQVEEGARLGEFTPRSRATQ